MGVVASKADHNTPLLNLCKERKELIRAARDARYQLSKSHLLYFRSLLDFSNALNQLVHSDLIVIPYSSDDDSSCCDLICSGSDSDSSDSDSECSVCDRLSQTGSLNKKGENRVLSPEIVPVSKDDQNPKRPKSGDDQTCGTSNVKEGKEKLKEGLGFEVKEFMSAPVEDVTRGSDLNSAFVEQNSFPGNDIFGLYDLVYNTQCGFVEPEQRGEVVSDGFREIREREGIPELEHDSDHSSLVRKNQKKKKKKKKNVQETSSIADKRDMKFNVQEISSSPKVASGIDKSNVEANTCNVKVVGEFDDSKEACGQETKEETPEIVTEVRGFDEEVCDEAYESSSSTSSSSSSEQSGSGLNDLRNVVERIKCISEKAVSSNSEVSELLEVSKVVIHQPLGDQFKGFASRVLGSSGKSTRVLPTRREENVGVSLSITLDKLNIWEKKLYAEVTVEEKLRVLYDRGYKFLKSLDQNGAEPSKIYEAEAVVKHYSSTINVSVRAVETVSMRIHEIRDEELLFHVVKIIDGFKEMWRFLAKCHHKQFQATARSKSCVHIVEKGSSLRKATHKVEEQIRRYRESLRGYIDAHRGFVNLLNEWLKRNIMEDEETETEAPEIFRVCSEWLREIEDVDEIKLLSAVEEMVSRFRGLGLKQVEEEKQRMRTERLSKELERKTKELEEVLGTAVDFPASDSPPSAAKMMVGQELLSLRECVTQEKGKHERLMRELNDAVSTSLQECLVPVFEALEEFCFGHFKAYQNIRIVSRGTLLL